MDYSKYMSVLNKVVLFQGIDEAGLSHMLNCFNAPKKTYKKDEIIAIEGEPFNGIGVILKGQVIVSKNGPDGERVVISKFSEGRIFGEMIAFSNQNKWPADVVAVELTEVIYVKPQLLVATCQKNCFSHHQLILNMLKIISNKALMLNMKVTYLSLKSMRGKLAMYLLNQKIPEGTYFNINMNRNELADFLNVSRPSMSRELGRMKEEGLIDYHKHSFKVLHIQDLEKAVNL